MWILTRNHQMDKEWKLEVFKWIFNPLRTANLKIFLNTVEWIFYHFSRVNSDISKGSMTIVMINWLKLFPVSKTHLTNLLISKVILSDPSHWAVLTKILLVKEPMLYFGFVGGLILIQDLMRPKILGDIQNLLQRFQK